MINVESMNARLRHLQERIERLKALRSASRDAFFRDTTTRDAVERNFQVAIECCLDIAKHVILARKLQRPDAVRDVFKTLEQAKLLPADFAQVMTDFAGMRNLLVHHYMTVDPEKLYTSLQNDLPYLERFTEITVAFIEAEQNESNET